MSQYVFIVMGVSGCGKSVVASYLAQQFKAPLIECDDLHTPAAKHKMASGRALNDDDRMPWLDNIILAANQQLQANNLVVITCSSLKKIYRDILRDIAASVHFMFLALSEEVAFKRVASRQGHFFPKTMVASQFATLEPPTEDEKNVLHVNADAPLTEVFTQVSSQVTAITKSVES